MDNHYYRPVEEDAVEVPPSAMHGSDEVRPQGRTDLLNDEEQNDRGEKRRSSVEETSHKRRRPAAVASRTRSAMRGRSDGRAGGRADGRAGVRAEWLPAPGARPPGALRTP